MINKVYDLYAQGESREVLLARIKDWLNNDVEDARDYTVHIKLVTTNKTIRELFEDAKKQEGLL